MKKYEIRRVTAEVALKDKKLIQPGMAQNYNIDKSGNGDTDLIASYDTVEEARTDLKNRKSSVSLTSNFSNKYYLVEEYFIEENEYDEDGNWISGGDILEYSEMPCFEIQYNSLMDKEKIYWTDSLEKVIEEADKGIICYTQEDVIIYKNGEEVARRKWYGVEPDEEAQEEEIIEIGGGFYAEWYVN